MATPADDLAAELGVVKGYPFAQRPQVFVEPEESTARADLLRVIPYAAPGNGNTLPDRTVPARKAWRIISLQFRLSTSAVAGTRIPRAAYKMPDGTIFLRTTSPSGQSVSATKDWFFIVDAGYD